MNIDVDVKGLVEVAGIAFVVLVLFVWLVNELAKPGNDIGKVLKAIGWYLPEVFTLMFLGLYIRDVINTEQVSERAVFGIIVFFVIMKAIWATFYDWIRGKGDDK